MKTSMSRAYLAMIFALHIVHGQNTFHDEARGVAFALPDAEWITEKKPPGPGGAFIVQAGPPSMSGLVYGQVTAALNSPVPDAEGLREYVLGTLEGREIIGDPKLFDASVSGFEAKGLEVELNVAGIGRVIVDQRYVVAHDTRFIVETLSPSDGRERFNDSLDRWMESVELTAPSAAGLDADGLRQLAKGVDRAIPWASSWDEAARQARREDKFVLVRIHVFSGFDLPDMTAAELAIDRDVANLVDAHFVPLRWTPGVSAPFTSSELYGLGERAFGSTFLVATPNGRVVHEGEPLLENMLRTALRRAEVTSKGTPAELLRRGDFETLRDAVAETPNAHEHRVLAAAARRERAIDDALTHIDAARASSDAESEMAKIDIEHARICAGLGEVEEAARRFTSIAKTHDAFTSEALLSLAMCLSALGDAAGADATWRQLAADHPETIHAAAAAAILTHPAYSQLGPLDVTLPDAHLARLIDHHERAPLKSKQSADAARDAVAYLLDTQRDNGAWLTTAQVTAGADSRDELVDATTALAARAMLHEQDNPRARAAADNALEWLTTSLDLHLAQAGVSPYMDYAPWSRCCLAWLLVDAIELGVGDAQAHHATLRKALDDLVERQQPTGGWTYFLSGNATGEPVSQSISFVTAFVLLTFDRARDVDAGVPDETRERALAALEQMNPTSQRFAYMLMADGAVSPPVTEIGSAARAPLCTLALLREERASTTQLRDALDVYEAHLPDLTREAGKRIMHAGPGGLGAHYVLFDHLMSAESLSELSRHERTRWGKTILSELLAIRRADGSFIDLPQLGPATGTALALLSLQQLDQ